MAPLRVSRFQLVIDRGAGGPLGDAARTTGPARRITSDQR